ncbi:Clavaminate synthase-like protein, partial [Fragilariopsis cylindrus CCMP1102]
MKIPKGKNSIKRNKAGTAIKKRKKKIISTTTTNNCTTTDDHDNGDDEISKITTTTAEQVTTPFSVRDVADVVGYNSPVQMIDVVDQSNTADEWTFGDLVEYFEDETRLKQQQQQLQSIMTTTTDNNEKQILEKALHPPKTILNQISYEFSGTPLHKMVRSPTFVREIDWIDIAWPDEKKPQHINDTNNTKEYPVVQYYCLTSAAGSYTDFHIDFGGSSVWYHVVRGQKVFVVSPPTRENLNVYEEWLCRSDQAEIFLPDLMKERSCPDVHSYSSKTLFIPSGWIHAVYTPVDSLVFGGNFIHGLDMQMQLSINTLETRTSVLDIYRFPHFGALQMYAGGMYLRRLR